MKPLALVTGASGVVAKAVLPTLDHTSRVRSTTRDECDLTDPTATLDLVATVEPDVILHLSGRVSGTEEEMRAANIDATDNVIAAAARCDPVPTVAVLGSAAELSGGWKRLSESAPRRPKKLYGLIKREQTDRALQLGSDLGVPVTVLRLFNFVCADERARGPVAEWRRQLINGDNVECGTRTLRRDYVTPDFLTAALAAFVVDRPRAEVINVCTGRATTGHRLRLAMAARRGRDLRTTPNPDFDDPAVPRSVVGSPKLMRELLTMPPPPSLDEVAAAAMGL